MCTAFTFSNGDFYFGRNMDISDSFGEQAVITPRNVPVRTKRCAVLQEHYAIIGMANVTQHTPLYAEAANEKGLCIASLNFPGHPSYQTADQKEAPTQKRMLAPYELIPYLLSVCATVEEVRRLVPDICVIALPFCEHLPVVSLHWIVADQTSCIVLEPENGALHIYDNPLGVLTNNPPFPFHQENVRQYLRVSAQSPKNEIVPQLPLTPFGQGMGAVGLPGDFSPASRFVKTVFCKWNSLCEQEETACISQVFHVLDAVSMVRGCVMTEDGKPDITTYSCCINATKGIYYYKTYENNQITAVPLTAHLQDTAVSTYPLLTTQQIRYEQ